MTQLITNWFDIRTPSIHEDSRGDIWTVFREHERRCPEPLIEQKFSKSYWGTLRGFHGDNRTWKMMSCIHGACLFVAYDLISKQKIEVQLDDSNRKIITIAPNVINAHLCLSDTCVMYYNQSAYYLGPQSQISIRYDDPTINASWRNSDMQYILSDRDEVAEYIGDRIWNPHSGDFYIVN